MNCKTCEMPIYPKGVTFTGPSCYFQGSHPLSTPQFTVHDSEAIKELTAAIRELSVAIKEHRDDTK